MYTMNKMLIRRALTLCVRWASLHSGITFYRNDLNIMGDDLNIMGDDRESLKATIRSIFVTLEGRTSFNYK